MSKRKSNDEIPCTSNSVIAKDINPEQPNENDSLNENACTEPISDTKKPRYDYNFWDDKTSDDNEEILVNDIKIRQLHVGKFTNKILKIRITYKSNVRNTKAGEILTFHGMDDSGEISFITYSDCRSIFSFLKINLIYSVKNFSVNEEKIEYPSGSGNRLQIRLNSNDEIEELGAIENFRNIFFKFVALSEVKNSKRNDRIDVIGVLVKDFGLDRNHKGTIMRELLLTDGSKSTLVITLWCEEAEKFSFDLYNVLLIRKGVVTEYDGLKKLNCLSGTLLWVNPDVNEADTIKQDFNELMKTKNKSS